MINLLIKRLVHTNVTGAFVSKAAISNESLQAKLIEVKASIIYKTSGLHIFDSE